MKISCIIPVFNGERYLREAIESMLVQTLSPFEIVVADDGSADGSVEIARSYGGIVRVVTQPTGGPAATRNLGWKSALGDYFAFLDADDLWEPEKLSRQAACFEADAELDYCVTHAKMFWSSPEEAEMYKDSTRAGSIPGYATTTLLARREVFERVGAFNESLWFTDATEWFIRAEEAGLKLHVLEDVLTLHRMHAHNLTRRRSDESRAEFLSIVRSALKRRRAVT
ncbi:glycosyltransferase family 2 protein [bacterium]|nr:MAG: glycosyltransferase family 2 protein [bacterium]